MCDTSAFEIKAVNNLVSEISEAICDTYMFVLYTTDNCCFNAARSFARLRFRRTCLGRYPCPLRAAPDDLSRPPPLGQDVRNF